MSTRFCTVFIDHRGQGHVRPVSSSHRCKCVVCNRQQIVPRCAWNRATRPTCQHCGGLLVPTKFVQRMNPEVSCKAPKKSADRFCKMCNKKLSSLNTGKKCFVCASKTFDWRVVGD